jgi:pimeloyl-ACP methyl ester carboxylesterase
MPSTPNGDTGALTPPFDPGLPPWLRSLYPLRVRAFATAGGRRMSFVDEGPEAAPPVVLVHGSPTWSFLYRDLAPRLRARYRVIAPDHVGFGLSDKPGDSAYHTLQRHSDNLVALLKALGLRGVTLLLHGWGGPIGLGYAARHPENVARIVFTNSFPFLPGAMGGIRRPRFAGSLLRRLASSRMRLFVQAGVLTPVHRPLPQRVLDAYRYPFTAPASRAAIAAFARMLPLAESQPEAQWLAALRPAMKKVTAPVEILWGVRDSMFTRLPAYLLRDAFKHAAEPVFLPDAAHLVPEEAADAVAGLLLREAARIQPHVHTPATAKDSPLRVIS